MGVDVLMPQLVMPKLGLTMTEGVLLEWHVGAGDEFRAGDMLFVVETEKVANEVQADIDGIIDELLVEEGDIVPVGMPLATLKGGRVSELPEKVVTTAEAAVSAVAIEPRQFVKDSDSSRIVSTPLARKRARELGVDLSRVAGSGPGGRIKVNDLDHLGDSVAQEMPRLQSEHGLQAQEISPSAARLATARRVSAAKTNVPHFYITQDVEVSALQVFRATINKRSPEIRISVTHLLIKALGVAMAELPTTNRIWVDDKILAFNQVDIGMVTETADGLRVPIIRDAGRRTLEEVAIEARTLASRAQDGSLTQKEVGGGSVSISNVGMFGASSLIPIINAPQAMILGVGSEQALFRPDEAGHPVLHKEICLTLACDHRVHDGADAARLLARLARILKNPSVSMQTG
ncbi:MAG TPA: 2-oxo acid dehydrogenase subunit E2 [Gammaproteobacteria bacterium]|nr:2-oxo acid dehydrogenase subunit E2 [Gammaproteobacteria bacterium]HIN59364.1 2-oxo acid dehydrogenase subunit E2 [Gammaproteobacteria bacterium]